MSLIELGMKNWWIIVGIVAVLVLGGAYYTLGGKANSNVNSSTSEAKVIQINASSFAYSPNVLTLKKGERVKIIVNDVDKTHGIAIPDLGVNGIGSVEFTPDKTGTFEFRCPTYCGSGHREMTGMITVTD
jgi:cytochrome c oxidase subunit 2